MKKVIYILFLLVVFAFSTFAQAPFRIQGKCKPPNASTYGSVTVESLGDIRVRPCPSRSTIFSGIADFTNATVLGVGGMGGSGTVNFIPRFTAATTLGNTPFSWNGTTYVFNNTALSSEWRQELTPVSNTGTYLVGDKTGGNRNYFQLDGTTGFANIFGEQSVQIVGENGAITIEGGAGTFATFDNASETTTIGTSGNAQIGIFNTSESISLSVNSGFASIDLDGGSNNISLAAGNAVDISSNALSVNASGIASLDSIGDFRIRNGRTAGVVFADATGAVTIGDLTFAGSNIAIDDNGAIVVFGNTGLTLGSSAQSLRVVQGSDTLRSTLATWDLGASGGAGFGVTSVLLNRTITPAGTTGNQTINLPAGTVNFAAGTSTLTVTNSTVTANSIINVVTRTNDATCSVKNYVPAAGSFVINMVANCTAEASVGFVVWN